MGIVGGELSTKFFQIEDALETLVDPSTLTAEDIVSFLIRPEIDRPRFLVGSGPGTEVLEFDVVAASIRPDATVIPLPAAGWLMIAGLGGLAALRRRA